MNFFLAPLFIQPPPICHWGDSGPDLRRNLTEEEPGSPQLQPQPDQQLPWKVSRCWGGQEVCEAIQPLQAKFILREVLHIRSQRCPPNKQHLFKTRSVHEKDDFARRQWSHNISYSNQKRLDCFIFLFVLQKKLFERRKKCICPTFAQVDLDMTTQPRPEGRTSLTGTRGSPSTLASVRGWTKSHMEWVAGQGVQGIS